MKNAKLYTVKASARRAAKAAGFTKDQYEVFEEDGKFGWVQITDLPTEADLAAIEEATTPDPEPVKEEIHEMVEAAEEEAGLVLTTAGIIAAQPEEKQRRTWRVPTGAERLDISHKSICEKPTKAVWRIADEMHLEAAAKGLPAPKRKEVMARCEAAGIAFYTARTQYQQWFSTKSRQDNA